MVAILYQYVYSVVLVKGRVVGDRVSMRYSVESTLTFGFTV